jgi:uncharacterized lipoprotein YmbA
MNRSATAARPADTRRLSSASRLSPACRLVLTARLPLAGCLALAASLALSGCSALAPRSDPSRYYFLTPLATTGGAPPAATATATAATPTATGPGDGSATGSALAVGLAEVSFPPYLERPELATRVAPNELHFSPIARWAEPLGPGFARVLAEDLSLQLGPASVVRSPWYSAMRLDCVLTIEVDHFEADAAGGDAVLVARWTLRDPHGSQLLRSGVSIHRRPLAAAGRPGGSAGAAAESSPASGQSPPATGTLPPAAAAVAALSELIADFSREMAAVLRHLPPGAPPARP